MDVSAAQGGGQGCEGEGEVRYPMASRYMG